MDAFLKEYIGADAMAVLGTELVVKGGRLAGRWGSTAPLTCSSVRKKKASAIGLSYRKNDYPFMQLCKEGYVVIFHDGLVMLFTVRTCSVSPSGHVVLR